MKRLIALAFPVFFISCTSTNITKTSLNESLVKIETDSGTMVIKLYNKTPLHRDNFVKLVKEHFYDGLLFHRVIKGFMIQGGDPQSKNATPGELLGDSSLNYTIPAEFDSSLFHKKGALAAAREGDEVNPEKASSASQFYLVQGKTYTDGELNRLEEHFKIKIPENHRAIYRAIGGAPFLDMNYTVFGEIISGLEVVDKIANAETDSNDRPLKDIKMKITLLKRNEYRRYQ
jgi:cyclophilin family peptidyl-prolyl cis-trans isomerase